MSSKDVEELNLMLHCLFDVATSVRRSHSFVLPSLL